MIKTFHEWCLLQEEEDNALLDALVQALDAVRNDTDPRSRVARDLANKMDEDSLYQILTSLQQKFGGRQYTPQILKGAWTTALVQNKNTAAQSPRQQAPQQPQQQQPPQQAQQPQGLDNPAFATARANVNRGGGGQVSKDVIDGMVNDYRAKAGNAVTDGDYEGLRKYLFAHLGADGTAQIENMMKNGEIPVHSSISQAMKGPRGLNIYKSSRYRSGYGWVWAFGGRTV